MKPGSPGWGLDPDPLIFLGGDEAAAIELAAPPGDYPAYYAAVRDAIGGAGELPVTPAQATAVMAVVEAGMSSSAEGRVVSPNYIAEELSAWNPLLSATPGVHARGRLPVSNSPEGLGP
jgi:hypothetical protein